MKNNHRKTNFYTQVQRWTVGVLLMVGLASDPERVLAIGPAKMAQCVAFGALGLFGSSSSLELLDKCDPEEGGGCPNTGGTRLTQLNYNPTLGICSKVEDQEYCDLYPVCYDLCKLGLEPQVDDIYIICFMNHLERSHGNILEKISTCINNLNAEYNVTDRGDRFSLRLDNTKNQKYILQAEELSNTPLYRIELEHNIEVKWPSVEKNSSLAQNLEELIVYITGSFQVPTGFSNLKLSRECEITANHLTEALPGNCTTQELKWVTVPVYEDDKANSESYYQNEEIHSVVIGL